MNGQKLANRVKQISASITLAITSKANELKKQGFPIISFGAGEPDFDTPQYIKNGAKKALDEGFTKYTSNVGILELRKAICEKLDKENNLSYAPNQIIVSNGAKQSLFNSIFSICDDGDEVIIFSPYWVTYIDQVKLAGGIPVIVETKAEDDFRINMDNFEAKITDHTKLVIINSPNNPSGAVYTRQELKKIAEIVKKYNLYVISDEIYEKIIYDTEHISIASLNDDIKKRTIVINGFSKSFSMTGWRVGYLASIDAEILKAVDDIQSHLTSNANSIAQKAAFTALAQDSNYEFAPIIAKFKTKRNFIVKELNSISNIFCPNPKGAFYVFPNIKGCFGKVYNGKIINTTMDFCNVLLDEKKVALVPGDAFGDKESVRISYALSFENMIEGITRITEFCNDLE
ncbi:MAG: pyridoxal phosphate-dependent aminotransferase [Elusimicrobiota bacterium]|jgi:aspartate aminotransferase|nr:pyridoxal phosphate-dependent aminotransferase [Elusimicrobiota bacterium]